MSRVYYLRFDVWLCALLMWAAAFCAAFNLAGAVRVPLGLIAVLVVPGYLLQLILFPQRAALNALTRLALTFGFSLAVVFFSGLLLNYLAKTVAQTAILLTLTGFTMAACWVTWWQRSRLETANLFYPGLPLPRRANKFVPAEKMADDGRQTSNARFIISIALLCVFELALLIMLLQIISVPKENLTEFYVLEAGERKAENYPLSVKAGEPVQVLLGIVNNEEQAYDYRVEVLIAGQAGGKAGPWRIEQNGRLEVKFSFTPPTANPQAPVIFRLFRVGEDTPYRSLRLFVEVK